MIEPLNDTERITVENNIKLVYKYLNWRGLDVEEFFDIVIFGYIEGVQKFMRRPELQQFSMSTVVFKHMDKSMQAYWKRKATKSREHERNSISLYRACCRDNDAELQDFISDAYDFTESIMNEELMREVRERLSTDDYSIVVALIDDQTLADIARMRKVSRQAVHQRMKRIRSVVAEIYEIEI